MQIRMIGLILITSMSLSAQKESTQERHKHNPLEALFLACFDVFIIGHRGNECPTDFDAQRTRKKIRQKIRKFGRFVKIAVHTTTPL